MKQKTDNQTASVTPEVYASQDVPGNFGFVGCESDQYETREAAEQAARESITATAAPEAPTYIEGDGTKMQLYVRSMGKLLAVTALFDNDDKANAYCETHADEGVVANGGGLVMVANLYDHGTRAEMPATNDRTKLYL